LNRPDANARFVRDGNGECWYRSGDVVRVDSVDPSCSLVCIGRTDNQVKLRGNRIELDEVERAIRSHPSVASVAVLAHGRDPHLELELDLSIGSTAKTGKRPFRVTRLVAYIEWEAGACTAAACDPRAAVDGVRDWLSERLPEFMVPAFFAFVQSMPLGPTGKLDRSAVRRDPFAPH
jgi:acyl-CoA synthetase (AMP-forming)/AMP-acid ligase II